MNGIPIPERAQLDAVVRLIHDVLDDSAIGAYLYGSAVTSGLRHDSDLDILVVSNRRTTRPERAILIAGLLATSAPSGGTKGKRHLEVTVVVESDIRPWHYPPPMELQYGDWWRREFESAVIEPWSSPNPDLAVLLTAARTSGVPLFGPPIVDLVDPIPRDDLHRALRDVIPDLLADLDGDVRNVLLTLARVWFTLETDAIEAKDVAAEWAVARLPEGRGAALGRGRAAYLGELDDTWDGEALAEARADAASIAAAIHALRSRGG